MSAPKVYAAICAVIGALAETGIAKSRKTTGGSIYSFRGIDDVYNNLAGLLKKHGLCMLPSVQEIRYEERPTKNGGLSTFCFVKVNFALVSAEDGSSHIITTCGEGMDVSDKATNKAMSASMKYAALMAFCIPTEGGLVDSETDTVERGVAAKKEPAEQEQPKLQDEKLTKAMTMLAKAKTVIELDRVAEFWGKNPPDILMSAFEAKEIELAK
jgi:hypothetical protein